MQKSQANRAIIERRTAARGVPTPSSTGRPATNLLVRVQTVASAAGPVRRTRCAPMTKAQRDSTGRYSDWNRPTDVFTDPAWSVTVSQAGVAR